MSTAREIHHNEQQDARLLEAVRTSTKEELEHIEQFIGTMLKSNSTVGRIVATFAYAKLCEIKERLYSE